MWDYFGNLSKGVRIIYKICNSTSVTKHISSLQIVTMKALGYFFFVEAQKYNTIKDSTTSAKRRTTIIKVFHSRRNHNDSTGDVILEGSAKSASTVPKSNWLCLICGSNIPRIITKTNTEPSYGPDPQGAAKGLLTSDSD